MKKFFSLLLTILALLSCEKNNNNEVTAGDANLNRLVVIGASITAGFSSYSLYREGQANSYGAIIANQLKKYNLMEGDFKIPYMPDDIGIGIDNEGNLCPRYKIGDTIDCKGNDIIKPVPVRSNFNMVTDASLMLSYFTPAKGGPFNLLAIPAAKSYHFLSKQYGSYQSIIDIAMGTGSIDDGNPFLSRMLSDPGNITCIDEAMKRDPTFFIIGGDIGGNDVLGYACSGGDGSITSNAEFDDAITKIVKQMTSGGAQGILGTIPYVSGIGYFRRYFYNDLIINSQSRVDALRDRYPSMTFNIGRNALVFIDSKGVIRQVEPDELVCLKMPMDKVKCENLGAETPLDSKYVLDKYEIQNVKDATDHYNETIRRLADEYNLGLCDWNATFDKVSKGCYIDGIRYSSDYYYGGIFSLDGVHATYKGYAWIANITIEAINAKYHANIPTVSISDYKGLEFPNN